MGKYEDRPDDLSVTRLRGMDTLFRNIGQGSAHGMNQG